MKLLLAEDEKRLSKAVSAILQQNNHTVDAVFDGEEAEDYLEGGDYDAVILDIMMPKKDGITVLQQMRQRGDTTPVIMLTAKSEIDDKVLGLDSGANDYLTKPFDTKELLARLRAITRTQPDAGSFLSFGNTKLNRSTFELMTESKALRLPNKEYQVMELLLSDPSRLISTERMMEKVWGFNSEAEINVVWVTISELRKKLADIASDVQIKATRNAGYSLVVKE